MPQKYDVNEPILVLIRRGRKGRGFTVCPVEDIANPAVCASAGELGEVIEEMLNDEEQPRVDVNELLQAASDSSPEPESEPEPKKRTATPKKESEAESKAEEDELEDEDEEEDDGIFAGVAGSDDPATTLLINFAHSALAQGRKMSSKRARARSPRRKKPRRT